MGRRIAMGLRANGVPLVVLELNPVTVKAARDEGVSIFYADATQPEVLDRVAVERAKAVLVTVPDPLGARAVVRAARERAPEATIAVRTKYASDARGLLDLGADEVVVEELETGLEMLARTLRVFDVPRARIAAHLDEARAVTREQGREINVRGKKLGEITRVLRRVEVEIVEVSVDSPLDGSTVGRAIREADGATILAVLRGQETVTVPGASFKLAPGDRIVVFGGGAQVAALEALAVAVAKKEEAGAGPA
jgi:CPA2 family monovalent cation:H+ antiporter-2